VINGIEDSNGGTHRSRGIVAHKSGAVKDEAELLDRTLDASRVGVHGLAESGHFLQLEGDALATGAIEVDLEEARLARRRRRHGVRRRSFVVDAMLGGVGGVVRGDRRAVSVCHGWLVRALIVG
jgi:hypothetical protein